VLEFLIRTFDKIVQAGFDDKGIPAAQVVSETISTHLEESMI
jgi:hypothetical protein